MPDDYEFYKSIGFKCGLEIHQRLATPSKLFCACPTNIIESKNKREGSVTRYQRAIAGELGTVDVSSGFEEQRKRRFIYKITEGHSCLVEIDEEPPHDMNREALQTSLAFARTMNMKLVDEIQPMRKGVVDGSDPSAFQRTAMVAFDGFIMVNGQRIEIPSIFVEEESCRMESSNGQEITYDVGMLGVPLVEIDTWPGIRSPKEAKDIALYIGTMMRITGKVQRGIGSVRQDVNVSIRDGARVEIKGLQEIDYVDKFIDNEVKRQQELLKIKDELKKRKASVGVMKELTKVFKGTKAKVVASHLENKGIVVGFKLSGFKGILGREVSTNRRLGTEISDYAKSSGVKGIIHSDENLQGYSLSEQEISGIRKELSLKNDDSFIIIAGPEDAARKAAEFAIERAKYASVGVPLETRGAINDGTYTTRFLRPLPGGSRMYPETDARPIRITKQIIATADSIAPNIEKEEKELTKQLKSANLARQMMLSTRLQTYRMLAESVDEPEFIANTLLQKFTELKRAGLNVDSIKEERLAELFERYSKKRITKQAVEEVLKALCKEDMPVEKIVEKNGLKRLSGEALKKLVEQEKKRTKDKGQIIREIMSKHRLNVDGNELNSLS
ncbi:MAG TPA: Glu-tRNA(Gln) amidotransferase subunit GatE [Candidatus Acidoferrum sp.]|nr:Glu-tRNA(Gln) amidotransferase subunit GatE [Candidatus Acidoferrum sp.]